MVTIESAASHRNQSLRELLAIAGLTTVFFALSVYLELFEWLVDFPIHHRGWHIPELSGAMLYASLGLIGLAVKRWHDLDEVNSRLSHFCGELEREKNEIKILSEMTDLLQSCLSMEESSRITAKSGQKAFPNDAGGIYLLKDSRNILDPGGVWGEPEAERHDRTFAPDDCWALRRGLPHRWDGSSGLRCTHLRDQFNGWSLCIPMAAMGETIGVLHLHAAQPDEGGAGQPPLQDSRAENFSVRFAAAATTALANLKLRETLRYQSVRDPLTGLFNRRYLEDLLSVEIGRAVRKLRPLSVIMLDADHFKRINDTFGHDAGDKVLRALAQALTRVVRKEDLACRYGGEEFIIVLPEAAQSIALGRAEIMRQEVHKIVVTHEGLQVGPITISAGVASFPDHGATAEALVHVADAALYQAKAQGRDRAVLAPSPESPAPSHCNAVAAAPLEPARPLPSSAD
jgi:diguanylate cyclase (GGDEF)-like protein